MHPQQQAYLNDPFKNTRLEFCDILGKPELHFAWVPRKCFDGGWVWLRPIWARLCVLKTHLMQGPADPWWQYARTKRTT